MTNVLVILTVAGLLMISGCAAPDKIHRIRSLGEVTTFVGDKRSPPPNTGSFAGIDSAMRASPTKNLDILFVHGIGWTQRDNKTQFGFDLAAAIADAYGTKNTWETASDLCPRSSIEVLPNTQHSTNGLTLKSDKTDSAYFFLRDDPKSRIYLTDLGCLDKVIVQAGAGYTVTIYRFFWDDALWNSLEWLHTGYDDTSPTDNTGYDDLEGYRAPFNANTKNQVLTWGLVDAAAYIGPAGSYVREGIAGALCAVMSAGDDYRAGVKAEKDGKLRLTTKEACGRAQIPRNSLIIMAHSLGSRAVFDVLSTDLDSNLARKLNSLPNENLEAYFLANQIPLFGIGRIGAAAPSDSIPSSRASLSKKLKFIAFSEVNDILTYELVPYFEHLYYLRCFGYQDTEHAPDYPDCKNFYPKDYEVRRREFPTAYQQRSDLVKQLGFDVVDVRAEFVSTIPILDFARPDTAHSGYLTESKSIQRLLVCGVKNGIPQNGINGCPTK